MSKAAELAKIGEVATNSQIGGRRNLAYNGAMLVSQRSTSVTGIGASSGYFTLDRFKIAAANTAGRLTMAQVAITDLPGFTKCLKLSCTTADASIAAGELLMLHQNLEGQDLQQLKKGTSDAEKVTVSFYVKANAAATYTFELADHDSTRKNSIEFSVTTGWTRVILTFDGDTTDAIDNDNTVGLQMFLWLHAGSTYTGGSHTDNVWHTTVNQTVGDNNTSFFDATSRTLFITGFQVEVGSVATPFENRSFGEELALCQRYYYAVTGTAKGRFATGQYFSATQGDIPIPFKTTMRAAYSLTQSALSDILITSATAERAASALALDVSGSLHAASVRFTNGSSTGAQGVPAIMILLDDESFIAFDAEI